MQGLKCTYSAYKNVHEKTQIYKIYYKYMHLNVIIIDYAKMHCKYMLHSSILIFTFFMCIPMHKILYIKY